ncbi:hypothetical protein F5B19DRAFT_50683 [Rostrohypoxylon terebratum]|nr:hypothetical protein F5B19DRAFT_50683 [Rostrohypoxylon terebratum]
MLRMTGLAPVLLAQPLAWAKPPVSDSLQLPLISYRSFFTAADLLEHDMIGANLALPPKAADSVHACGQRCLKKG